MDSFSIELGREEATYFDESVLSGKLCIGAFSEKFNVPLTYWNREQYIDQWREGLGRILNGKKNSVLFTSMYDPSTADFYFCWVFYVIGKDVYIQNHALFLEDLNAKFDERNVYTSIQDREIINEEGEKISEWVTDIKSIEYGYSVLV